MQAAASEVAPAPPKRDGSGAPRIGPAALGEPTGMDAGESVMLDARIAAVCAAVVFAHLAAAAALGLAGAVALATGLITAKAL